MFRHEKVFAMERSCIVGQKPYNINFFSFRARNFVTPNHRIGAHTWANHTVPYGTVLLGWRCPRHFVPGYDRTVPPGRFATVSIKAGDEQSFSSELQQTIAKLCADL